jgi:hypothetical protein
LLSASPAALAANAERQTPNRDGAQDRRGRDPYVHRGLTAATTGNTRTCWIDPVQGARPVAAPTSSAFMGRMVPRVEYVEAG